MDGDDNEEEEVGAVAAGFRFYPTEEELVSFYLQNKLKGTTPEIDRVIPVLDIYDYNPSDLPRLGGGYSPAKGEQWFFFSPWQGRGGRGRPNRLTKWGYWKATGSPGHVYSSSSSSSSSYSSSRVIGRKRSMVFYAGRAPNGTKTLWKMIQYNAFSSSSPPQLMEEVCLWRIYKRSKSLGAFDRRPPSVAAPGDDAAALRPPRPDYSSSSGDNTAAEFVESGNNRRPENPTDGENFWDFERSSKLV